MDVDKAVSLALRFIDGLREDPATTPEAEARAFIEHLAVQGFLIRRRDGREWRRIQPNVMDVRGVSPGDITTMRMAQGLSVAALAKKVGITPEALRRIETARSTPQARTLKVILDTLGRLKAGIDVEEIGSTP